VIQTIRIHTKKKRRNGRKGRKEGRSAALCPHRSLSVSRLSAFFSHPLHCPVSPFLYLLCLTVSASLLNDRSSTSLFQLMNALSLSLSHTHTHTHTHTHRERERIRASNCNNIGFSRVLRMHTHRTATFERQKKHGWKHCFLFPLPFFLSCLLACFGFLSIYACFSTPQNAWPSFPVFFRSCNFSPFHVGLLRDLLIKRPFLVPCSELHQTDRQTDRQTLRLQTIQASRYPGINFSYISFSPSAVPVGFFIQENLQAHRTENISKGIYILACSQSDNFERFKPLRFIALQPPHKRICLHQSFPVYHR